MYLYDYHIHSSYSSDGNNSINELCISAIASGLQEIAITDHFEPSLGKKRYPFYKPCNYFLEVQNAEYIFSNKMKIKYAVELGQPHLYPEYSQKLIESYPYDYVLASVHRMIDNKDFGEISYDKQNISSYCIKYLDGLKSLANWNHFDCLGHMDLVKRYASKYNIKASFMDYRERLEEILQTLIYNGKGIEVNTSGLRQFAKECLPGFDIISFYKKLGGEIITIGSDAHVASDVGKGIKDAIEIVELAGFKYITVYKDRQPSMIRLSGKGSTYCSQKQTA